MESSYESYALLLKTDQEGNEEWHRIYPGLGFALGTTAQQTTDKGYIVTGATGSPLINASLFNVLLLKIDQDGNEEWIKTFEFLDRSAGLSVQQTHEEGYIITGYTISTVSSQPLCALVLIKTNNKGVEEWNKTFKFMDINIGYSVQQTYDEGYIVTGYTLSSGELRGSLLLIKIDKDGGEEWIKTFEFLDISAGLSVQQTHDKGYIIGGFTQSSYESYALLLKTDQEGNKEWHRTYPGLGFAMGIAAQQTTDKGYIVTGVTTSPSINASLKNVLLLKTDKEGNKEWERTFFLPETELGIDIIRNKIIIKNIGESIAYEPNADVDITGILLFGFIESTEFTSDKLLPGDEVVSKILGLGIIKLTVSASAWNAETVSKTVDALLLGSTLILLK